MNLNFETVLAIFSLNGDSAVLVAIIFGLSSFIVLSIAKHLILRRLQIITEKTKWKADDTLVAGLYKLDKFFLIYVSFLLSTFFLTLPPQINSIIDTLSLIIFVFYAVRVLQTVVQYAVHQTFDTDQEVDTAYDPSFVDFLSQAVQFVVWVIAIVMIAENIGYNVSTLVGGLGIMGIAIAFALQNVLSDVFSFFSIYLDKPFKTGDFIIIDQDAGTVQKIGMKSTRIKTLQGQELVVSNKELTEKRINNYKRMEKRRIVFTFGVTYDTPNKKLEKINQIVTKLIEKEEFAELDRVHFHEFGPYSLNYEVIYHMTTKEYDVYMDTQQRINLSLKETFEKEKIEFAFPTQTVQLER